ncbi:MAG: xanthine dehydrogenase [Alphaproteobacteria bacterium]|nr:xanthine dehydrogenase [Alphaproteobacteria bacterium]
MRRAILERLQALRATKTPVALCTNLRSGEQLLVTASGTEGDLCIDVDMVAAAQAALKNDECTSFETPPGRVFVHVFTPPPRVIVVGAVHIAETLARMAALAGYGVTIIDPRRSFAGSQRFENITVDGDWPDEAMTRLAPDMRTAVVTLTHDPKLDDPALDVALRSPAFYVGALGSRKTHAARLQRLAELGHGETALARIHGPVGLDIGALSPAEIALSVMAQITAIRRGGETRK